MKDKEGEYQCGRISIKKKKKKRLISRFLSLKEEIIFISMWFIYMKTH
jgi:hypothetical protein